MRHRLRVLLVVSAAALTVSLATMVAFLVSGSAPSSLHVVGNPASASAQERQSSSSVRTGSFSGVVTDSEVCGMLTTTEVYRLLNFQAPTGVGTPAPLVRGGACDWGTGEGEAFEVTVAPRMAGSGAHPCAGIEGSEVRFGGWVGCSRLDFGNDNVLRAFEGSYVVTIEPEVNVIGSPYLSAEESTVSHVFRELSD